MHHGVCFEINRISPKDATLFHALFITKHDPYRHRKTRVQQKFHFRSKSVKSDSFVGELREIKLKIFIFFKQIIDIQVLNCLKSWKFRFLDVSVVRKAALKSERLRKMDQLYEFFTCKLIRRNECKLVYVFFNIRSASREIFRFFRRLVSCEIKPKARPFKVLRKF